MAIVVLKITIEGTSKAFSVPCYVLQSCKPLWNGELYDCALVLGTNALEALGFWIMHPSGELVNTTGKTCKSVVVQTDQLGPVSEEVVLVIPDQTVRIGPFQSKVVKASISAKSNCDIHVGMITPIDKLANM